MQEQVPDRDRLAVNKNEENFFVEDDLSLINGLTFAMEKQGYEITVARTNLEAEKLWGEGAYDLVILDVSLPDGSGFDFAEKSGRFLKCPLCSSPPQTKRRM